RGLYVTATTESGAQYADAKLVAFAGARASVELGQQVPGDTALYWMGSLVAEQQDASGLLYRRHRYYDPASGRFTQPDPIGIAGGLNSYGYANGDPVNFSDPFGLCKKGVEALSAHPEGDRTTVIVCADSTEEVRSGGTPAWRNNNPGNLRSSSLQAGVVRGFAVFNNRATGNEAMWEQVDRDAARGLTLGEFINKYAPNSENNTRRYIDVVSRASGVAIGTKLSDLTEVSLSDVIRAMQVHEGWSAGRVYYRPIRP
ncbi:MAG TPA: RHS repeat-associated core domain-containing protein, partial [Gemmatimonadaceae bacterium]|nr:RHS repeat-associated core domain-containing protein [Gemmatimonadaceae bacterium]